ncbi:hypothetical protein TW81_12235 [Vibrio galatheae]|uniref:Uncharacterized protein n=1 Tax=Vibrio galatheae TaxID=579748 RepID=A0A0F4NIM7_9VIBR|nr:hypothetical protein TW81_12235 [Vibrio galatheae]
MKNKQEDKNIDTINLDPIFLIFVKYLSQVTTIIFQYRSYFSPIPKFNMAEGCNTDHALKTGMQLRTYSSQNQ